MHRNLILNLKGRNIFAFSDTHGEHEMLEIPSGTDILICAGDAVEDNLVGGEYDDFIHWFAGQTAQWKLFIPGNHELSFDLDQADSIIEQFANNGILVLQDAIEDCDGVVIGSISGNTQIAAEDIPTDLDILVTHYPPYGILDAGYGSIEILNFVMVAQPQYLLFGHVHATSGQSCQLGNTKCFNISVSK